MHEGIIKISKQKVYDSLLLMKMKYRSFDYLCVYATYTPYQGLRLNYKVDRYVRRTCWMKDTLELTDCLHKKTLFDMAEAISLEIELWIRQNNYQYDINPDIYTEYMTLH